MEPQKGDQIKRKCLLPTIKFGGTCLFSGGVAETASIESLMISNNHSNRLLFKEKDEKNPCLRPKVSGEHDDIQDHQVPLSFV